MAFMYKNYCSVNNSIFQILSCYRYYQIKMNSFHYDKSTLIWIVFLFKFQSLEYLNINTDANLYIIKIDDIVEHISILFKKIYWFTDLHSIVIYLDCLNLLFMILKSFHAFEYTIYSEFHDLFYRLDNFFHYVEQQIR